MKNIVLLIAALVMAPAAAFAQAGETAVRESIPAGPFLAGAYAFIWVAVLVYVVMLARNLGKAQGEVEALRRRVEGK